MFGRVLEHEGKTIFNEERIEGRNEGIAIGEACGRSNTLDAAIDFMRSNGMTNEQIDSFRNSFLNS